MTAVKQVSPPLDGVSLRSWTYMFLSRLETQIRNAVNANDHVKIDRIVDQLCNDYAFAVHQPHARNGGLIGLAAASIALGPVSASSILKPRLIVSYRKLLATFKRLCLRF